MTGEEIRARLTAFAGRWSVYEGSERAEAQTFLNELFECYGTKRADVAQFEQAQAGRFLDLIWPRACLIEMKAPSEAKRLDKHRKQALDYWAESADPATNTPAPRWVVLCAFRKLEIWEPGLFPGGPRVVLDLIDLPDQYDALLFLAGDEPVFAGGQAALTREAVVHLVDLYERLAERDAAGPDELRDFLLQSVWCLFAEDLGQIPAHRFSAVLEELIANPHRSSADEVGQLFTWLNTPGARPQHGLRRLPLPTAGRGRSHTIPTKAIAGCSSSIGPSPPARSPITPSESLQTRQPRHPRAGAGRGRRVRR